MRSASRESGRSTTCLSNVQQITTSLQSYAQDYDDRLPPTAAWMDSTAVYTNNAGTKSMTSFACPTVLVNNPSGFGYAYNSGYALSRLSKITNPSVARLIFDSSKLGKNASDPITSLPVPARHRGRQFRSNAPRFNIMGYADGHAKAVTDQGRTVDIPGMDSRQQ